MHLTERILILPVALGNIKWLKNWERVALGKSFWQDISKQDKNLQ